jgi:cobalt-zinc-cadmium resistance protein CzcA
MIDNLIAFSIRNKLIVGIFTIALIAWGVYSVTQLPIDAVPDITNNQVQVMTVTPALAAQEVEQLITFPLERSMATIPGILEIRSFSRFGLSVVTIVFEDKVDIYWARQQVTERMGEAEKQIPLGIGTPELAPVTTGLGEIYQYVVHTKPGYEKKYSSMDLRTIQDWIVKRQLLGTPGVADVSSFGGYLKQYEVAIDPEKLRSMNVSISDIFTALEKNNQNTGGAYIDKKPNAYFIRSQGLVGSIADIEKIVVKNNVNGLPLLIRDLATVQLGSAVRYGASVRNDEGEVVSAIVMMLKGENSSKVINAVKLRIAQISKTLPEGVVIEPFLDRTKLVNHAVGTVTRNLAEGALIVIFILVLMLGNLRAGLVVASVIPLAMLFAISMMNVFGVSGNLMSLGAIDFGLIVESIVHRVGALPRGLLTQKQMDDEVYQASSKIRTSAAFGEIIILIVYLPILALVGTEGKMFKPMAQTVSFAIIGAFILSLTYVPMMSALVLSKETEHKRNISDKIMGFFHRIYDPLIVAALNRKLLVILVSLALLILSFFVFRNMGGEFIPTLDEGDFAVETRVMAGSSLSETIAAADKANKILLKKFPEIEQIVAKIGSGEIPTDPMPVEACDLMIILKDKSEWTSADTRDELAEKMAKELEVIPGAEFGFQQPIQMRFNELMTGARQDVVLKIYGEDLDVLTAQATRVSQVISGIDGAVDLYQEAVSGLPQIVVKFDRDKIAQFGLNIEEINRTIRTAFAGQTAGLVFEGEKRFDLVVRFGEENRKNLEDVQNLFITAPNGTQIPLQQVASVGFITGPNQIQRDDTKRRITVGFNVRKRDVESIVEEVKAKLETQVKLPPGYYVTYGGQFENLVKARARLSIAVPVALLLIFTLLYFTFGSAKHSLLIFTAVPLSAIGGILALWIRGMPFSISAGVGFIALFGVAVLNGIVLLAEFNRLKKEGMTDLREIVLTGTKIRLRPVIMTAMVASLGFLPMALSNSAGAEVQKPLATVVIGGLVSATLLTLLVLPVLYLYFERRDNNLGGDKSLVKKPNIALCLTGLILFISPLVFSQSPSIRKLSVDQAVEEALKNNRNIHAASYEIDAQRALKGTWSEIGKTDITFMKGQYNSIERRDNSLTLGQTLPFPTVMARHANLSRTHIRGSELNLSIAKLELANSVKSVWYQLSTLQSKHAVLMQQDSIYSDFLKAAELRFKTGEANYLEKVTVESQAMEMKARLRQNDADIKIFEKRLQTLLYANDNISVDQANTARREIVLPTDTTLTANNPRLKYLRNQIDVSKGSVALERAKLLPDINVGYFNQTLIGYQNVNGTEQYFGPNRRFSGFQVGVSVPLWANPQLARLKAAGISEKIAQSNFEFQQKNIEGEYAQLMQEYLKQKTNLEYYEKNALPQADLILKHAQLAFKNGAINYLEYSMALNRVLNIRSEYMDVINNYNQSIIDIELIMGY